MLCSKCYKKITQGEEIQIKGSIVCKKCTLNDLEKKEIIGKCHGCFKTIYKDEIVREVCENWGVENSEKLIKCQHCYKNWLEIAKLKRESWKITRWFDNVFLPFNMWFVLAAVTINKNKESAGWGSILLIFILSTSVMLLSPLFSNLMLFVYQKILERKYKKLRKERKKLEQKRKKLEKI